jgi:hypothetical protein
MEFNNIQYDNNLLGLGLLMSDNLEVVHLFLKNPTNVRITEMVVRLTLIMILFAWLLRYACMCCSTQHLREQLEAAENEITEQGHELDEKTTEIADLRRDLFDLISDRDKYKSLVDEVDLKYLNCREAAKRFIETHPECDTVG